MLYKPPITRTDAKRHLRDIRCQYQKQIAMIIEECEQIRSKHKQIFDSQWNSDRNEKTFLVEKELIIQEEEEEELPMVEESVNDSSESSLIVLNNAKSNTRILSPKKNQRCLSVSSVASIDKRANRVYEQWPDYPEISQIVGYRIEKPVPIVPPSPQPVVQIDQKKGKKPSRFANAAKKVQNMSTIEKEIVISKPIIEQPIIEKFIRKEIQPKLPTFLCPTSELYSKRIRTRQWLLKNDFSSQSHPLI